MKKNLRRILATFMVSVFCMSLVAGCGADNSGSGTETEGQQAEGGDAGQKEYYKIGYAAITMDGDFFVTLADALAQGCADQGLIEKADRKSVV